MTENKVQLIDMVCRHLIQASQQEKLNRHRLIITGQASTPTEVYQGVSKQRDDLRSTHEEADVIMIHQVVSVANGGARDITVLSDDTDVFILLLYHFSQQNLQCSLTMEGTVSGRAVIDIAATVEKHANIILQLPAAHALTGCDTVAQLWGLGKATGRKIVESGRPLDKLGDATVEIGDVISEATAFVAACYGSKEWQSLR